MVSPRLYELGTLSVLVASRSAWELSHGITYLDPSSPVSRNLQIGGYQGLEERWLLEKSLRIPNLPGSSSCMRLSKLLAPSFAQQLLAQVQSQSYAVDNDSVDGLPSFEYYPMINGTWSDEELGKLLQPMVQELILPYVRSRYSCEECTVAEILVRRYLSEERRTHNLHFDGHAYATVVLGLTPPDEYEGGLYIQPTPHSNSRRFVQLEPGDLFVHSFDLQHGVRLWSGSRYSLIFWIKSSPAAVATGTTPWYHRSAAEGDPDAMYNLAGQFLQGIEGEVDVMEALRLYEKAAKMGHYGAQHHLSLMLLEAAEPNELVRAARGLRHAADAGFALAQKSLAFAYANGQGLSQDLAKAAHWMLQAAEQDDLEAAYVLSSMYRHGQGFPTNNLEADRWLRASAEANYADAMRELSTCWTWCVEDHLRKMDSNDRDCGTAAASHTSELERLRVLASPSCTAAGRSVDAAFGRAGAGARRWRSREPLAEAGQVGRP
ncbi:unnamed protein product [Durusdinium trenchii]|uniref:Fe2OG dioxygenase domain-containing protein n=1 Tax=Durusdinium trenchii TaxID=1381693 RepID=A0ABP0SDV8_9DINO